MVKKIRRFEKLGFHCILIYKQLLIILSNETYAFIGGSVSLRTMHITVTW